MDELNKAKTELTVKEINEMEERRIGMLQDANIDEMEVLEKAKRNINSWNNYFNENITRGKSDAEFVVRDQWTSVERGEFTRLFKPALTFNKLNDIVRKTLGEQRKNKPDLIVRSLNGKATQQQIDLRADLVRTISYKSQNNLVYQTSFRNALMIGFGAFQVRLDYENPYSFFQDIIFEAIPDPTKTSFDPSAVKPHKGDGNFCSRNYMFSKEEFNATYPYIQNPESYYDPRTLLDFQWETRDGILVCDYYQKEWFSTISYKLSDGTSMPKEKWEAFQKSLKLKSKLAQDSMIVGKIIEDELPKIVGERQTQDYKLMHYRLIKNQIVDFAEWPSKYLPIIFVDGDSCPIEGQQYTKSLTHDAKDAQRFVNFVGSEIAAEIKNRRREQWIGTPENIIGNEQMWRNPEQQLGILLANPDPKTGLMPTKMNPWDISPALLQHYQRGNIDIREIIGFSEAQQMNESGDISGKAKRERKIEASMASYIYFDNLNQAIEQAGRVVNDLLGVVYTEERFVTLAKANGITQSITLNKKLPDGTIENELVAGEFDVEIDTGPSFAVQKETAMEFLMQLISVSPQVFNLVADLAAKNLDVQFMPQLVERLKTLVPPQILAEEEGKPIPPPQPSPEEQMHQMEMQLAQQQLMDRAHELQIREKKHELEKAKLIMDAQQTMAKSKSDKSKDAIESKKADLDFTAKITKILADLHAG